MANHFCACDVDHESAINELLNILVYMKASTWRDYH